MSAKTPSLQKQLFTKFVAYLVFAQVIFLGIGIAVVSALLEQQQMQEITLRSEKAVELFGNLAKYGDVRYARFVVRSNGVANGLKDFRIHASNGEEIQASDPQGSSTVDPEQVKEASLATHAFPDNGDIHVKELQSVFRLGHGSYYYALKTADGTSYIVTTKFEGQSLPWLWIGLGALGLILLSGCIAVVLARGRIRKTAEALSDYAGKVRAITVESDPEIAAPFSELLPLQDALSSMVVDLREQTKNAAISKLMSSLSHDIRKPFSIVSISLKMLGRAAADPAKVTSIIAKVTPEISKAVASVDSMLADILEFGSTATEIIQEPTAVEMLLDTTLNEIFRVYPKSTVEIGYDLKHNTLVSAHTLKVARVLGNLIGNAVQAIRYNGKIWLKSQNITVDDRDFVQFCIGNAGFIPADGVAKLFSDSYYTSKKEGTGLGTMIAMKIVKLHGGKMHCESSKTPEFPEGKVEFFFTLPAEKGEVKDLPVLPRHSSVITNAILALTEVSATDTAVAAVPQVELDLEADILKSTKVLGRSLRILIVDDEDVYRQSLASQFTRTPELTNAVVIRMGSDSNQALELLNKNSYDLIISDVDMGLASSDGFELVKQIRGMPAAEKSFICVHTNRIVPQDHKRALDAGADSFLSKPSSRGQILKLVLQAAQAAMDTPTTVVPAKTQPLIPTTKPAVLVLDDNPWILDAWVDMLKPDATVHLLDSPEALAAKLEADPNFLNQISLVVTDQNFDGSTGDGLDIGRTIKARRSDLTVLLSSDGEFTGVDMSGRIDRLIGKVPVPFSQLIRA